MGGIAPANQLRLSFTGSEDGEAETETCRAAKPLWRTTNRTSGPRGLNSLNRRMRTRMYGGVAGESGRPLPLCRSVGRQIGGGGDAAVVDADGCGASCEGCCETCVDWGIGDGGDGRNRGAPVRVNGDVLSGAVTEGTGRG